MSVFVQPAKLIVVSQRPSGETSIWMISSGFRSRPNT